MPRLTSVKVIVFFLVLAVLDHTVLTAFRIGKVYPSCLYLFVCYASIAWETKKTMPVAFWGGLLKGLFGGGLLGVDAGIMVLVAAFLDHLVRRVEREFPGIYFLLAFLFVFTCETLKWVLAVFTGASSANAVWGHLGEIFAMALYTAVFFPVFSFFADFWFGRNPFSKQYELFR